MDPASCRVIYIDDRFNTERWISRDGLAPATPLKATNQEDFSQLPPDLQANVNAFLTLFNQVYVCNSGRSFSIKLSELHDQVKAECIPILACFDVGSESRLKLKHDAYFLSRKRLSTASATDSPPPSPNMLRREITFSSESDESYGLQLLSRIASDLQVDQGVQLIIPVAVVQPRRKDSYDQSMEQNVSAGIARAPYGPETEPVKVEDKSEIIEPQLMLQCLEAGALDVVKAPLDKAAIMGLTVHAYRIYKHAMKDQASFMALANKGRKASWVSLDAQPYSYLREAMVRKLLKGICEPQHIIEDYQHRDLDIDPQRKQTIATAVGRWDFDAHEFSEDELVYAGYYMLDHAVQQPELKPWRVPEGDLLRFMQGCRVAYNSFVLYHNFRHAVDVLQSLFYFLLQIGILPPYPVGSTPPPLSNDKSPIAKLLGPFQAMTLLISAIGHDVGHPGVNNMFLVKLNSPLAQLYNDQSVLEAFHCAAYSQILRRHWPAAFNDKGLRKLMISSILATDMGVHSDYMQQLGNLQSKIHESGTTDGWAPKDIDNFRVLACGLLIKCADISNVARPWAVAEKWTHLLQKEFAKQGEMEEAVGIETTLFGGPPELGNNLKLANGQIGFMTIFAHPLFANVTDIIPAMGFAANEIITNKGVWFTRAEQEKLKQIVKKGTGFGDGGAVSPRSQSPTAGVRRSIPDGSEKRSSYFPSSPLKESNDTLKDYAPKWDKSQSKDESSTPKNDSRRSSLAAVTAIAVTGGGVGSRRSSADSSKRGRRSPQRKSKIGSTNNVPNGNHEPLAQMSRPNDMSSSGANNYANRNTTGSPGHDGTMSSGDASDEMRDSAVSMRAGSSTLPVSTTSALSPMTNAAALSAFRFATSDEDEPVRTYDPQQNYPAPNSSARASAPAGNQAAQVAVQREAEIAEEDTLTPSRSMGGTSHTTERTEDTSGQAVRPLTDFEKQRNRAASAPMHASPNLRSSFSLSSTQSGSIESSKYEKGNNTMSNGDFVEGLGPSSSQDRDRKQSTRTLGRKRSRIKMGLTFWKKKGDKEGMDDGASTGESQQVVGEKPCQPGN